MGIREFTFDRALTREFINYPYVAYRDDPQWVPPLRTDVLGQLQPGAQIFRCAGSRHCNYLAKVGTRVVGRVTASIRPDLNDVTGAAVGCLGFFEAEHDTVVAADLIGAAVQWLRGQGARRIWGPINFDIWHGYRLMIGGFRARIFSGEPYNKEYYPELFERCGLVVRHRWHSYDIDNPVQREHFTSRGLERRTALLQRGYRFVPLDTGRLNAELPKLHALVSRSYEHFPGFTRISLPEFTELALPLRYSVLQGFAAFVHNPQGEACGFAYMPLDLSEPLRAMRGRSDWLARVKFFRARRSVRGALLHVAGLTPEEASKHSGAGAALIAHVADHAVRRGHSPCVAALVAENSPARGHLRQFGARATREYALFEGIA